MTLSKANISVAILGAAGVVLALYPQPGPAYITNTPVSFGQLCSIPPHISEARIEQVSQEKGVIIWRKIRDLKGKYPLDVIKHSIGKSHWPQFNADMQKEIMRRAVVGKTAIFFHGYTNGHGNDINVYLDEGYWYAVAGHGEADWCYLYSDQPALLRLYSGSKERLATAVRDVVAGKEVVVPCLVDGSMDELRRRVTKVHQLRASLKLQDYNPKRDFVRFGAPVDYDPLPGMPGFTHRVAMPYVGPEALAISCTSGTRVDGKGDGKPDLCLIGAGRVALLKSGFQEAVLPSVAGCRAAVWADYNGDGRPDLLLATLTGPRLFTQLEGNTFKDDTVLLPREACYNVTAAAWIDYDGDGHPDILFCNGVGGLRLYRNKGQARTLSAKPNAPHEGFDNVSEKMGLGEGGIAGQLKGDTLSVCDVNGDGRADFLLGAGSGILVVNTSKGFVEAKDSGISYKAGKVAPAFGDFDNSGIPGLFVPQLGERGKLFKNDGTGHFTDVTAQAGDLAKLTGTATCAAWGDIAHDGRLDLVVGCLRGPNRYFRNLGNGKFEDATEALGLSKQIYNTQAVCLVDLNNDGVLDMAFNNEGQESVALIGAPPQGRRTAVLVHLGGSLGRVGTSIRIHDPAGKLVASRFICGSGGRGGQQGPLAHFSLVPGTYQAVFRFSSGVAFAKEISVGAQPLRTFIEDWKTAE